VNRKIIAIVEAVMHNRCEHLGWDIIEVDEFRRCIDGVTLQDIGKTRECLPACRTLERSSTAQGQFEKPNCPFAEGRESVDCSHSKECLVTDFMQFSRRIQEEKSRGY
jgi:hypothetical protein